MRKATGLVLNVPKVDKSLNFEGSVKRFPQGYWKQLSNQRTFFDQLGNQLGIQNRDEWYQKINTNVIVQNGGGAMLNLYNGSAMEALMSCYPEHNWIPWKFKSTSQRFWKSIDNQKQFFDWLGKELGVQTLDDWYSVLSYRVVNKHAGFLTRHYNGSPIKALMACYPQHNWLPWKFTKLPPRYWNELDNQKQFFDWLAKQLDVKSLDDWYSKLNSQVIIEHGGAALLAGHASAVDALRAVYPHHNWEMWRFPTSSHGYWNSTENISHFLTGLSQKLCIQTLDDWYRVDVQQLASFGAASLVRKYGGLCALLQRQYPDHPWEPKRFATPKKAQRWLVVILKQMYPNEEIMEDYIHPKATFPSSNRPVQLDVYIPSKSLAFEYQGEHHYQDVGIFGPVKMHHQRDEEKRVVCNENNIKLIQVPYWWDRTQQSLQSLIN